MTTIKTTANVMVSNVAVWDQTKSRLIMENINFHLTPGLYGLVGPNGSGKTTLLQTLAGIQPAARGHIEYSFGERMLTNMQAKERLGYVPQEFALYEEMTVYKYLRYVARMKLIDRDVVMETIVQACLLFGLDTLLHCKIEKLSTGQKKKVMLAQSILNDPHFLLLDEPMESLDMNDRWKIWHLLSEMAHNKIIFMASHLVDEMKSWADGMFRISGDGLMSIWSGIRESGRLNQSVRM